MSGYRTIGRQTTNATPAWRAAMSATDTVYTAGQTAVASGVASAWVYPSGSIPSRWGDSTYERRKHSGFGGAVFLPDQGSHGTLVFGGTGEGVWENNFEKWQVSDANPAFGVWCQPAYHTDSAACVSAGDDVYYSPTDAANTAIVAAARKFTASDDIATLWDRGFPMSLDNWVYRRKPQGWTLKGNQPHWFRYNTPIVVPAWMARTTKAIILCKENSLHGPFAQGWKPSGVSDTDFHTDLWGSGRRKWYAVWQDTASGAWSRLASAVPDMSSPDTFNDHAVLDTKNRRVYYLCVPGTGGSPCATYYLDLASGIASATFSALTAVTGAGIKPEFDRTNICITDQHPTGKRLLYFRSDAGGHGDAGAERIGMVDLDTGVAYDLNLGTRGMDTGTNPCVHFSYRPSTNEVLMVSTYVGTTPRLHKFTVPSDPTSAANYTVTNITPSLGSGVSIESQVILPGGKRWMWHEELGCFIGPQTDNAMLAVRPSW